MPPDRRRGQVIRAAGAIFVALAGSIFASFGNIHDPEHRVGVIAPAVAGAVVILLAGLAAVRTAARSVREGSAGKIGDAKGSVLARVVGISGAVIVVLWTLSALRIGIQTLLLGGALTGVVLGIAAQQTLGNIIAGIVLLIVKPFLVGEKTVVKSTIGEYEGEVTNIGFLYVSMVTKNGRVDVPNAVALASAVGPGARTTPASEEEDEEKDQPAPTSDPGEGSTAVP
jgi:small-conductance mechanosensitive channel